MGPRTSRSGCKTLIQRVSVPASRDSLPTVHGRPYCEDFSDWAESGIRQSKH
jgi:hypothetical protein